MSNQLIAIVGSTGSGKTTLAIQLAKKFNGVLVSADSRQVYRGLDIGTNKEGEPGEWNNQPARIIDDVPQLMIDIAEPGQRFTLNDWLEQARYALKLIWAAGQLPIIVGGTGLYVTALLEGYQPGAGRHAQTKQPADFQSLVFQPDVPREVLYQRSDERFPKIFDALINETQQLIAAGVSEEWLEKIGLDYRYNIYVITGQLGRAEAITNYQQAAHAYIRRQLTWWRHHGQPILIKTAGEAATKVQEFLRVS